MTIAQAVPLSGVSQALFSGQTLLLGLAVRNSHATNSVTVRAFDSASAATGTILMAFTIAAGATADVLFPLPLRAAAGVYVEVTGTGSAEGSLRVA